MNLAPVHSLAPINPGALARLLSRRGLIFLVLALAACVPESQNPAGDPAKAVKDPALNGLWQADWEDGRLFLHVFDGGQGMVDVYTVNHKKDAGGEDSGGAATYVFVAYQMEADGKLDAHFIDDKAFIAAVTAGKLKGQVSGEGEGQTVLLTDDAAKIVAFMADQDDATLYGKGILFRRIYPSASN